VLETVPRKEELNWRKVGKVQPTPTPARHTGLSGGAPDSVRCARLADGEPAALEKMTEAYGYNSPDCPVVHRTVRWANGRQRQRSATQSAGDAWPATMVGWAHQAVRCAPDSVRCANRSQGPMVGCDRYGRRSRTGQLQGVSGGAPDCLVHHSTEGKDGLPNWSPTAPSCLGAIKGTPRHMEEHTKLTRNILKHLDSAFTQSDHRSWDLSTIRVVNSSRCVCVLTFSLVCVVVLQIWVLRVLLSHPYSRAFFVISIVRARDSKLGRFLETRKNTLKEKTVVFKLIIGSLERGWVQPSSIGTPQRGSRQVLLGRTTGQKSRVSCVASCDCFDHTSVFHSHRISLIPW
jgi:hypothetical protein